MDTARVEAIRRFGDTLADEISARISFLTFLTAQVYHPLPRPEAICFGFHRATSRDALCQLSAPA